MSSMKDSIVFFGSGPVAARSLELLAQDFKIEAVITKPIPKHHRGDFPVLTLADKLKLPLFTASNKQELDELFAKKPVKSRLAILIDFGIIVSQAVIDYFPLGIVNSHFSVLPEWRGADPITFAILSGQKQTGISLMLLVPAMDEGPLIAYGEYYLPPAITTPELTTHLINLSHLLLTDAVPKYIAGDYTPTPQEVTGRAISYSRKLTKQDGVLDFNKSAVQLEREIRAFIEWPKSHANLAGKEVIVTHAETKEQRTKNKEQKPGTAFITDDKQLAVVTGDGLLVIKKLKPAGKNEMTASAFLQGYKLQS